MGRVAGCLVDALAGWFKTVTVLEQACLWRRALQCGCASWAILSLIIPPIKGSVWFSRVSTLMPLLRLAASVLNSTGRLPMFRPHFHVGVRPELGIK